MAELEQSWNAYKQSRENIPQKSPTSSYQSNLSRKLLKSKTDKHGSLARNYHQQRAHAESLMQPKTKTAL